MPSYSKVCPDANFVINGLRQAGRYRTEIAAQWESLAIDRTKLLVPALLLFEVTNVFYQLERAGKISSLEADRFLRAATLLPFEIIEYPTLHLEALEIARTHQLKAAYDAHYLAVARRERIPLITSDRKLVEALGDGFVEKVLVPFADIYE